MCQRNVFQQLTESSFHEKLIGSKGGWSAFDINVDKNTLKSIIFSSLIFLDFTLFNKKYVFNFFRKLKTIQGTAVFKLMNFRVVALLPIAIRFKVTILEKKIFVNFFTDYFDKRFVTTHTVQPQCSHLRLEVNSIWFL